MSKICPRVIIAIPTSGQVGRDQISGVFAHLDRSFIWDIRLFSDHFELTSQILKEELAKGLAGVLTSDPYTPDVARLLTEAQIPVVAAHDSYLGKPETGSNFKFTLMDNVAIGRRAAEYFKSLGRFSSYAFICDAEENTWSKEREHGYRSALQGHSRQVSSFFSQPAVPPRELPSDKLGKFLSSLNPPVAVFAANDSYAIQVLNVCHHLGLKVPEQISVLGVDNDTVASSRAPIALSSIEPDFRAEGQAAAATLAALLADGNGHKRRLPRVQRFGICRIVERASSTPLSPSAKLVEDALAYIAEHGLEPISPASIAARLRVSRPLLDLRFRQIRNDTVSNAIRAHRLNEVRRLLKTTDLPISRIASDCGFRNENHLRNLFRKTYGLSMRAYRKA